MKIETVRGGVIRANAEVLWDEPPGHFGGANSKMLMRPEGTGSRLVDYRISVYQPRAYVTPHRCRNQEQIHCILDGEGLMEIDGERAPVEPLTTIFRPSGVEHVIYNSGVAGLRFIIVTCPPEGE